MDKKKREREKVNKFFQKLIESSFWYNNCQEGKKLMSQHSKLWVNELNGISSKLQRTKIAIITIFSASGSKCLFYFSCALFEWIILFVIDSFFHISGIGSLCFLFLYDIFFVCLSSIWIVQVLTRLIHVDCIDWYILCFKCQCSL